MPIINIIEPIILSLINISSLFLIIVILSNSWRESLYRWFVLTNVCIVVWVDFAYLGYRADSVSDALIAYRINLAAVSLFLASIYTFYVENILKKYNKILKYFILIPGITFSVLSLTTPLIIEEIIKRQWGNEIEFGVLNSAFTLFATATSFIYLYFSISSYRKTRSKEKDRIRYFLYGTFALIFFNLLFNVIVPSLLQTAQFQHFGDYSAVIFLGFTIMAVLRKQFLNVKVALGSFLITFMSFILLFEIIAVADNNEERVFKIGIFIFFIGISILLMKSITSEIKQKEGLEIINSRLETALAQIQEARRRERDMIDIMGHELRTPISIVKNALSFMDLQLKEKGTLTDEQLDKYIAMGLESARREADLIETMLSATKADAKGFDLNFEKVDLNDVINDSFAAHKDPGIKKGLEVIFEPDQQYYVYCDRTRIQEISDNFISNAIKYTKNGFVKVSFERRGGMIWTVIEDTGIGIAQEEIKSLGKKFFRAHQHMTGEDGEGGIVRPGGTGLGLYVSFALAKLMDGGYTVESEVGKGSTFSFGIPEYDGQPPQSVQRKLQDYVKVTDGE